MAQFFATPVQARVLIAEPTLGVRTAVTDALKGLGFGNLTPVGSVENVLEVLETESVDWIISGLFPDEKVNAIHLLKLLTEVPRLRRTRVSLFLRPHEAGFLPLAYDLGLLSHHDRTMPAKIGDEIRGIMRVLEANRYDSTLTSAAYLRRHLLEGRHYGALQKLMRTLLEMYPGSTEILLNLGEAQFLANQRDDAVATIAQVKLLSPEKATLVDETMARFQDGAMDFDGEASAAVPGKSINALGIERFVIIDPDSAVQYSAKQLLVDAAVPQVEVFSTGDEAWKWIEGGGRADFIQMEWKLPGLSGPQLVQRIRNRCPAVPILVASSLVGEDDAPLVREMGVASVLEKPFDAEAFFKEIIFILQQQRLPTEQASLGRKIVQSLQSGNMAEAQRLRLIYLESPAFENSGKMRINAEFAFHEGKFVAARDLAIKALRISRDSLELLGLLGKALLKLGKFDDALKCFHRANSLSPRNVERLCQIAHTKLDAGRVDEAKETLVAARQVDAGSSSVIETDAAIALTIGDTEAASKAMAGLDSLNRIMASMNNKAVALVRCGNYDEGISLYQNVLASLPGAWGPSHDSVCYNLALAYIRYSELDQALVFLDRVQANVGTPLGLKTSSLRQRVVHAQETNSSLTLSSDAPKSSVAPAESKDLIVPEGDGDLSEADFAKILAGLASVRGDICCFRVFLAGELLNPECLALLKNPPRFRERIAIARDEAMQVKPGA